MHRKLKSNDYKPHKKKSTKRKKLNKQANMAIQGLAQSLKISKHKKIEKECIKTQQTIANSRN